MAKSNDSPFQRTTYGVKDVAKICGFSVRHAYRLIDANRIPKPSRLGALILWPQSVIDNWINAGMPDQNGD